MTRLLLLIMLSASVRASDPNHLAQLKTLANNWLKPVVPVKNVFRFDGITPFTWAYPQTDGLVFQIVCTPASSCTVTGTTYRPVNLNELKALSKVWKGDPNYIPPVMPIEPNIIDIAEEFLRQ